MNRTGRSWRIRLLSATAVLAATGLTVAGCGGGGAPAVSAPPASAHTTAERAAVTNWLVQSNQMWTDNDFAAVDQITTGQMRAIYLAEQSQASLPKNADRVGFQLLDCRSRSRATPAARPPSWPTPTRTSSISAGPCSRGHGVRASRRPVEAGHGRRPSRRRGLAGAVHAGDAPGGPGRARRRQLRARPGPGADQRRRPEPRRPQARPRRSRSTTSWPARAPSP